jgi:hypothetical protein
MFLTALMQVTLPFAQVAEPAPIRVRLGAIQDENRPDSVNQFAGSFIGSRIYGWKSWGVFVWLAGREPSWDEIANAPIADIEFVLAGAIP